jgi:uncharacterized membrane protein YebE (DUF533 family)
MSFLDRLVSDLVRRQTGFDARRIVRRVGGKRLLLLGGAALAGGMLASQSGRFAGGVSAASGAAGQTQVPPRSSAGGPRPADPSPGLPPLPPLPPLPVPAPPAAAVSSVGAEAAGLAPDLSPDLPPDLLYAVLRTMVAAALADGELHPEEKRLLDQRLGESGLSEPRLAQLRRDLVLPAGVDELARALPPGEDAEVLARFAVLVAGADRGLVEHERAWLRALERALRLPAGRIDELEREIFPA